MERVEEIATDLQPPAGDRVLPRGDTTGYTQGDLPRDTLGDPPGGAPGGRWGVYRWGYTHGIFGRPECNPKPEENQ